MERRELRRDETRFLSELQYFVTLGGLIFRQKCATSVIKPHLEDPQQAGRAEHRHAQGLHHLEVDEDELDDRRDNHEAVEAVELRSRVGGEAERVHLCRLLSDDKHPTLMNISIEKRITKKRLAAVWKLSSQGSCP